MRASTWPWGETIGNARVSSYSARATLRIAGSESNKRSGFRLLVPSPARTPGADVESITCLCREILLDDLILEVVYDVPVAVHHHAAGRAENGGAARAAVGVEAVAALPLPNDSLSAGELEYGFLGVGELPVVV